MSPFYGQQNGGYFNNYRMSPYGAPTNMPMSNFSQLAIDESRSAFSSIESIIHTFRSISLMLESTFTSVYSSFRAVTDIFDYFSRMRSEITLLYPLVLLWRFVKHLYDRLLRFLRLRQARPGTSDETWSQIYQHLQSNATKTDGSATAASSSSSLLVLLYFVVSFGMPMLMLKVLNSMIKKRQGLFSRRHGLHLNAVVSFLVATSNWLEQDTNQARVLAIYDYVARNSDELSFTSGTTIHLAPAGE